MDSRAVDYQIGRCRLVTAECRLLADGVSTGLGKRAVNLLRALIERRDRLVTKEELFQIVWRPAEQPGNLPAAASSFIGRIVCARMPPSPPHRSASSPSQSATSTQDISGTLIFRAAVRRVLLPNATRLRRAVLMRPESLP